MNTPIYLDYAATSPMAPEAAEAMQPFYNRRGLFANPASTQHYSGEKAESVIENSRAQIAEFFKGKTRDFIFHFRCHGIQ